MSVLSRNNWVAQMRGDQHDLLMLDSFVAFDFRSMISALTGSDKAYVIRGLEVVGKTGLSIQINVDSQVFNPQDGAGAFYQGMPDDENLTITLPASQASVYVEAKFKTVTGAPINRAYWDPLALTGEDASGTEYSAATDSQVTTVLEITTNTLGFTEGAIPLLKASTDINAITSMEDRRPMMWRLGTGGSTPDPLHQYNWSASRTEPVPSGTGVGDAVDSPWRAFDGGDAVNDKAFKSLKDWADAVMTRISEVSGSALWYTNGVAVAPVANVSLNQTFFDTLGHNIRPSAQAAFVWKRSGGNLVLAGEGTVPVVSGSHHVGLVRWQSNYSKLEWHLGGSFASSSYRNYTSGSVRFESPVPDDQGNVYLKLEREVPKGSGDAVSWADAGATTLVANKSVSGQPGDFTGIALGDFIRKKSEGYSRYYRVVKMTDGTTYYDNSVAADENRVADSTIIALQLEMLTSTDTLTVSTEPLRYFRSRYSNLDLYADQNISVNGYQYLDADFYWLGRRNGDLFYLRNYGTMQEGEEVNTLNDSFMTGAGDGGLAFQHGKEAIHDGTGYRLKTGVVGPANPLITIYRRKRDNTVATPGAGSNANALIAYTIETSVTAMTAGQQLWVRLSDTTGGALTSGVVTNSTDELDNTDTTTNKWEIRSAADTPLRSADNKDVFLLARCLTIGGQTALLFADGSVLGDYGRLFNQNVEITGETKLTPRTQQGVLFISETIPGQVDDEAAQLFYTKSSGTFGFRTFRATDNQILLSVAASVNFLTNLGNNTLTVGSANSTTYIPGDLIVAGNTVAAQVSQIQSEDKVITLGVGNALNGGYDSGIEVADNTINGTQFDSTNGSPDVVVTLASAPGYSNGDIIGVSATTGIGGITAGEIGGQYTVVAALSAAGEATISGSTLTLRTAVNATSTASSSTTPPRAFKPEWSVKVSGAGGSIAESTGYTSWAFQAKGVATTPTLTPVASYGIVPTAHSTSMSATRIPFVNNDNAGPSGADSTLNFSGNLTWDNGTNTLGVTGTVSVTGTIVPGADDTYDVGTTALRWNALYLGQAGGGGLFAGPSGDVNLYWSSAGLWKTDDSLEVEGQLQTNSWLQMEQQVSAPAAPAAGLTRIWADDDGLVYQKTPDGDIKLLTNLQGNVYEEHVDVVASPVGNNQMAPIGSPPSIVTLPKDTEKLIGTGLVASVTNGFATVTVTKISHGLLTGESVTIVTSSAIGGIAAVDLDGTFTCTVINPNTFTYTATASATSTASGSLDTVKAVSYRYYTVGAQELEVYLNGQFLRLGVDWTEVGTPGNLSNNVSINRTLVAGDVVTYRIDSNGGQYIINAANATGDTLQDVYDNGNSVNVALIAPIILNPATPPSPGDKLLQVNGDVGITGVIDPSGITFTPQASDPFTGAYATAYGLWTDDTTKDLIYKRAGGAPQNLSSDFVKRDGSNAMTASLNLGGQKAINGPLVGAITNPTDLATKAYVDAAVVGSTNFDSLSDVIITTPISGQIVRYDGANWVNVEHVLDNMSDVVVSAPALNQILKYNGTNWANVNYDAVGSGGMGVTSGSIITLTTADSGKVFLAPADFASHTFDGSADVGVAGDIIIEAAHGLTTGMPIVFTPGVGATMPTPLVSGTVYYIIVDTINQYKIATSYANAIANAPVNITANGSGTITAQPSRAFVLPAHSSGRMFTFKNHGTSGSFLIRNGSAGNLEGIAFDYQMGASYGTYTFISDGTEWWRIV